MRPIYYACMCLIMLLFVSGCNPPYTHAYAEEHVTQWENASASEELHSTYGVYSSEAEGTLFRVEIPLGKWKIEIVW